MAKMRPPKIPDKPVPVLPDDDVRHLLAECSGKDFRDRRDLAIIRLFLDTGMRLEGMAGLRYSARDPEASDVDLRSRVVRITAKGRRELVLPIGAKSARDIDRYIRVRVGHPRSADAWLWLGTKGRLTASGVHQMIKDQGTAVGLPDLHPHQPRHTFSYDWQRCGVASDATFRAWREDGAVRDGSPGTAERRSRRQSEPAGQDGRDRTVLRQVPGCCVHSGCVRRKHDAEKATKKRIDEGRCHHRPVVTLTRGAAASLASFGRKPYGRGDCRAFPGRTTSRCTAAPAPL